MLRQVVLSLALGCGGLLAAGKQTIRPELHLEREAESDIEIAGRVEGVPAGETRFVSRTFIESLPHVSVIMRHNDDYPEAPWPGIPVRGVYLEVLARGLGVSENGVAAEVICKDHYSATFTKEYVRLHRPILVTEMEGLSLHEWAMRHHAYDAGPYLIGYEDFHPSFHVLSHEDRPEEPAEILRLGFYTVKQLYGGIMPSDAAATPKVMAGYKIARQNCFRCHNAADHGGTKAGRSWSTLGGVAKSKPEWFAAWVRDPQSLDKKAAMPPNPEYDRATLDALTRYFSTFAVEGK